MAYISQRGAFWRTEVRRRGYKPVYRTFDTKQQAQQWARRIESEMGAGSFIDRTESERTTRREALERYQREMVPEKRYPQQERQRIKYPSGPGWPGGTRLPVEVPIGSGFVEFKCGLLEQFLGSRFVATESFRGPVSCAHNMAVGLVDEGLRFVQFSIGAATSRVGCVRDQGKTGAKDGECEPTHL